MRQLEALYRRKFCLERAIRCLEAYAKLTRNRPQAAGQRLSRPRLPSQETAQRNPMFGLRSPGRAQLR